MADGTRRQAVHKSGPLKQQNKAHKSGKHRTKGQIAVQFKGRVSLKSQTRSVRGDVRKSERKNKMKQVRANKRQEAFMAKRNVGVDGTPPHLVVVLGLSESVDCKAVRSLLTRTCSTDREGGDEKVREEEGACTDVWSSTSTTVCHPGLRQRFTLVFPPPTDLYTLLDVAKVADTLLLVYDCGAGGEVGGEKEELALQCCYSQGLPATCHVIQGLEGLGVKERNSSKKTIQKKIETKFPGERVHVLDTLQDASNVLRFISNQKRRPVTCRDMHPHLLVETAHFHPYKDNDEVMGSLQVSGYVRGRPLSVNGLLHIPGLGDFQMTQITAPSDPHPMKRRPLKPSAMATDDEDGEEGMTEDVKVVAIANPTKQESLVREVELDPMEGEQTWPTEDDFAAASHTPPVGSVRQSQVRRVPQGTSDYQAAWIVDDSEEEGEGEESEEEEEEGDEGEAVMGEEEAEEEEEEEEEGSEIASEMDTESVTYGDTERYDEQLDLEAEEKQLELLRSERENVMFPDEVDTPMDTPARIRFQKYRGLKSFRTSPWDPRENLPRDYARIFQFENFARTKKRVLAQEDDEEAALAGWYVTLHVKNVGKSQAESLDLVSRPLVVFGLLQHENKMSVVHFVLRRSEHLSTTPIKSKERLVFQCGVRRFTAAPIFSQHATGDKQKYERFFPREGVCVASVFAPISYPPQPVLVFKPLQDSHHLLAMGSLFKVDPDRVVSKRIILSGHPLKIHKRSAVIRYMFFNREDIQWFKPIELRTKHGRRGHIKEPLGTHGHMKCVFDGQLKAHDTVLMNLYKRVYPKWTYTEAIAQPQSWGNGKNLDEDSIMS